MIIKIDGVIKETYRDAPKFNFNHEAPSGIIMRAVNKNCRPYLRMCKHLVDNRNILKRGICTFRNPSVQFGFTL